MSRLNILIILILLVTGIISTNRQHKSRLLREQKLDSIKRIPKTSRSRSMTSAGRFGRPPQKLNVAVTDQ